MDHFHGEVRDHVDLFKLEVQEYSRQVDGKLDRLDAALGQAAEYVKKLEGQNFQIVDEVLGHVNEIKK